MKNKRNESFENQIPFMSSDRNLVGLEGEGIMQFMRTMRGIEIFCILYPLGTLHESFVAFEEQVPSRGISLRDPRFPTPLRYGYKS